MVFENGLKDLFEVKVKDDRFKTTVYKMPNELFASRGDQPFLEVLSINLEGKTINTKAEFLEAVKGVFQAVTGKNMEDCPDGAYASVLDNGGMSGGQVTTSIWIGERPIALDFIAEHYGLGD